MCAAATAGTTHQIRPRVWEPAKAQLDRVLRFDDSLFAVEEQNLFVDEVRETNRWVDVFQHLQWDRSTEKDAHGADEDSVLIEQLVTWVRDGLLYLGALAGEKKDGPLGWASDPAVFAICTRLVRVSVALSANSATKQDDLERAMSVARDAMASDSGRVSGLLTEPWGEAS
ncbi:hypothetical protein E4U22_008050 [Claviceps purpurea]|nr:hypothetical protein E4U22_008050 [Claviceps purpurea]